MAIPGTESRTNENMFQQGVTSTGMISGAAITTSDNIVTASNIITTGIEAVPDLANTPFGRNALKKLIVITQKLEEFFEYKFYIHPTATSYSFQLSFNCDLRIAEFARGNGEISPISWSQPLLLDAKGNGEDMLKISELLQATSAMIWAVMCFSKAKHMEDDMYSSREPLTPNDQTRKFIMECAKGFVLDDQELPEEALGKLALLTN